MMLSLVNDIDEITQLFKISAAQRFCKHVCYHNLSSAVNQLYFTHVNVLFDEAILGYHVLASIETTTVHHDTDSG